MQSVTDNIIRLTRGDTGLFSLVITGQQSGAYAVDSGDEVRFSLKKRILDEQPLISKTFVGSELRLDPEDTANLTFGEYLYDVQLTLSSGDVHTVIPPTKFIVEGEIS